MCVIVLQWKCQQFQSGEKWKLGQRFLRFYVFYARQHYALAHICYRPSVCPAVRTSHGWILQQESCAIAKMTAQCALYTVWVKKNPPYGFLKFFPKRLGIFNQFFAHLFYHHFYTRVQIFIQISPTLTKLCHTKRDHLAKFYISLEL